MAPEVFTHNRYDEKCDMWAAGVILYLMVTGIKPFNGPTPKQVIKKIKVGSYDDNCKSNLDNVFSPVSVSSSEYLSESEMQATNLKVLAS